MIDTRVRSTLIGGLRLLSAIVISCLGFVFQIVPTNLAAKDGTAPKTYSHDAHGLEKQFEPLLKAYAKGDADAVNKEYAVFVLPNANQWFAEYFPASSVQQLGWDYDSEAEQYKSTLPRMMKILQSGSRFHAHCSSPSPDHKTKLQPNADSVQPTKEIALEQFEIKFVADNGRSFSQLGNFVYVDGAFRYLGKGAYPFWSMPDATRKAPAGEKN